MTANQKTLFTLILTQFGLESAALKPCVIRFFKPDFLTFFYLKFIFVSNAKLKYKPYIKNTLYFQNIDKEKNYSLI